MSEVAPSYHRARARFAELLKSLTSDELNAVVPACPEWSVTDALRHVAGMPVALAAGSYPSGDANDWIQDIVDSHASRSVDELCDLWNEPFPGLDPMLNAGGYLLFIDLVTHEHDVRAAVNKPGGRDEPEVLQSIPFMINDVGTIAAKEGLGALEVHAGGQSWVSHTADVGWSIDVTAFEATRILESRRTAEEILATPGKGDPAPWVKVINAHLPLPAESLNER